MRKVCVIGAAMDKFGKMENTAREEATLVSIDAIESAGIRHLIRPNVIKPKNQKTGDTDKYKEFAGGRIYAGGLNSEPVYQPFPEYPKVPAASAVLFQQFQQDPLRLVLLKGHQAYLLKYHPQSLQS